MINFNSNNYYLAITYPQDSFLQGLLNNGNESHVLAFLKETKIDLAHTEVMFPIETGLNGKGNLLHYFATKGWCDGLKYLMEQGISLQENLNGDPQTTPLFLATWSNKPSAVVFLLDHGANPVQDMPLGAFLCYDNEYKAWVNQAISQGLYKPEILAAEDYQLSTTLMERMVLLFATIPGFLDRKDIVVTEKILKSCLLTGNAPLFLHLLNHYEGYIHSKNQNNKSLFEWVSQFKPFTENPLLLSNLSKIHGTVLLNMLERGDDEKAAKYLQEWETDQIHHFTFLCTIPKPRGGEVVNIEVPLPHYLALKGSNSCLKVVIEKGIDIKAGSATDPLLTPFFLACVNGKYKTANYLLDCGVDPNQLLPINYIDLNISTLIEFLTRYHDDPEVTSLLQRKEFKISNDYLIYLIINNFSIPFVYSLARYEGNDNAVLLFIAALEKTIGGDSSYVELLLNNPKINLKSLNSVGNSVYKITLQQAKLSNAKQYEYAQQINDKTEGFVELIELQKLMMTRFNTGFRVKIKGDYVKFSSGCVQHGYWETESSVKSFLSKHEKWPSKLKDAILNVQWPFNDLKNQENKIAVISSGWNKGARGHEVAVVFCSGTDKTYLMVCNRGEGSGKESGIVLYEVQEQEKLDGILTIIKASDNNSKSYLTSEINTTSSLKKILHLKHKDQFKGNCASLSPKTSVRACLIAAYLEAGETLENAVKLSLEGYKEWAAYDKVEYSWERFLSHPYLKKSKEQRESEGVMVSRTIQECLMHAPKGQIKKMIDKITSLADLKEIEKDLSPLHQALLLGNVKEAAELIEGGASLNETSEGCFTPLHIASWKGYKELVVNMLQKGAQITQIDKILPSPTLMALKEEHQDIVDLLIKMEPDVNSRDFDKNTLLNVASKQTNLNLIKQLLDRGADASLPGMKEKMLPLHSFLQNFRSKKNSQVEMLEVFNLIAKSTDVNAHDKNGYNALHHGVFSNCFEVVDALLKAGTQLNAKDKEGRSPLHLSLLINGVDEKIIEKLIEAGSDLASKNKLGNTLLHSAMFTGNFSLTKKLIEMKVAINETNAKDETPLMFAADQMHEDIVRLLLESGANPNLCSKNENSPLTHLIINHHKIPEDIQDDNEKQKWCKKKLDIVSLLAKASDLKAADKGGYTPLHCAILVNSYEVVDVLLKAGTPLNIQNNEGETPITLAFNIGITEEKIIERLIEAGSDLTYKKKEGGNTFLHGAVVFDKLSVVKKLIDRGVDVNAINDYESTPLILAINTKNEIMIDELLRNGANPNISKSDGMSPLIGALIMRLESSVEKLLEKGANPHVCDLEGHSALSYAVSSGNGSLIQHLIKHKAKPRLIAQEINSELSGAIHMGLDFSIIKLLADTLNPEVAEDKVILESALAKAISQNNQSSRELLERKLGL